MSTRLRLDPDSFLDRYWQREHLYLPGAIEGFTPPLDADELAGLAMEPGIDSRIVHCDQGHWRQVNGPFDASEFQRKGAWSLLVQSVDHYIESVAELRKAVDWLPTWRLDDVLMSYATDKGSAAPHVDNYDVFIIQGQGKRRWQIGETCSSEPVLQAHAEFAVLENFTVREEYILSTGDMLYLPPGCSHYGVSLGESTSFSIGFRAPRISDLLARYTDCTLESMDQGRLYRDPQRQRSSHSGEISHWDLQQIRSQIQTQLEGSDPRWLGEVLTGDGVTSTDSDASPLDLATLPPTATVQKSAGSRIAWHSASEGTYLFANGASRTIDSQHLPLVQSLCSDAALSAREIATAGELLEWLWNEGALQRGE